MENINFNSLSNLSVSFQNLKTGNIYCIKDMLSTKWDDKYFDQLVNICNQPQIYTILFENKFKGQPYSIDNAKYFYQNGVENFRNKFSFIFLIFSENNEIAGAMDIKSNILDEAEIGYWASKDHSGIMTPAVGKLIQIAKNAGFKKLYAKVKTTNIKSESVLLKTNFKKVGLIPLEEDRVERIRFELLLT